MDPLSLVLMFVGYMLGLLFFKGAKHVLTTPKGNGSIAISTPTAGENYDMRWNDPEYVRLIHKTIVTEERELGEVFTVCECQAHKIAEALPKAQTTEPGPAVKYNEFIVDGYIFNIRDDRVPANAYGEWDARMQYGVFRWVDSKTGKMMMMKALPSLDVPPASYNVYSDQQIKPIAKVRPARQIDSPSDHRITTGTIHLPDEPKNHIMFTSNGPVRMSELEMRAELRRVRELDRKRKTATADMGPN